MEWISVIDRPLFTKDEKGYWTCTEDGDKPFLAAVPYEDKRHPGESFWWIRLCYIKDEVGLCVITDEDDEYAGWEMSEVTHYIHQPEPPKTI